MNKKCNGLYYQLPQLTIEDYITVFTPTYNRSRFLNRVYTCLKDQTSKRFIWILVNDGSSDDTDITARTLLEENSIPMIYINKENGGKHSAFKVALENTQTEFFLCMDDDDLYDNSAIETYLSIWTQIKKEKKDDIGAVRALSRYPSGHIVSNKKCNFPVCGYFDRTTLDHYFKFGMIQENWTCYSVKALNKINIFNRGYWLKDKHKFVAEGIWQTEFARRYKCRYINKILREYREDADTSLMRTSLTQRRCLDLFINKHYLIESQIDYFWYNPLFFIRQFLIINVLRSQCGIKLREEVSHSNSNWCKVLLILLSIVSPLGNIILSSRLKK